jgi:hypothetical protein
MLYTNSITFDRNIDYIDHLALDGIVEFLTKELQLTGKFSRWHSRHSDHLRLIILNLFRCHCIDPEMHVAYFRYKNWYTASLKRYDCIKLKYESFIKIVDTLWDDFGYVQGWKGHYDRVKGTGETSRMRATPKLIALLLRSFGFEEAFICRNPAEETIILKVKCEDKKKKLVDYEDTAQTTLLRANLNIINGNIANHFVGLCVADESFDVISEELKRKAVLERKKGHRNVIDFRTYNQDIGQLLIL